ncbi:ATP-dependent DNA helicase [Salix suchowensis]|nr:ATP-dependent DNA helicase [Salix suchowensis]
MELITTKSKREHMWRVGPTPKRACYNMWQALDAPLTAEGKMTALIEGPFLALVLESVLEKCTCTFRVAMGNNTTAKAICGACARTTPKCHIESLSLDQIPHHEGLSVLYPHPDQYTTTGMVLYEKAVTDGHTEICHDCMAKLKQRWRPVMSLSNNMWIGDIPSELSSLTLPDQSLPPHPRVLAAMIGITFVGLHNAPKQVLRGLFRVSCKRVRCARVWLRKNNLLYHHVEINKGHIQALPVDDVPTELHQIAKLLTDGTVLEDEHGSYVPNETDSQNEGKSYCSFVTQPEFLMDIDYEDPSIIPVQSHGMINTDTAGIPDLQLLSSALANTGREMAEYEELLVKHSSAPVNKYP